MAIVKMKKFSAIALDSVKDDLLTELMELGVTQINRQDDKMAEEEWTALVRKDGNEDGVAKLESELSKTEQALKILEPYDTSKKPLFATRKAVTRQEFSDVLSGKTSIENNVDEVLSLNNQLKELKASANKVETTITSLKPWVDYAVPLNLQETKYTTVSLGVIPSLADINSLISDMSAATDKSVIGQVGRDDELQYLSVVYYTSVEDEVLDVLRQHGFSKMNFKDMDGTAAENIAKSQKKLEDIAAQAKVLEDKLTELVSCKEQVKYLHDEIVINQDQQKVKSRMLKTGKTFYIDGWLPAKATDKVEALFDKYQCYHEITEPDKEEDFPVLLQNNSLVTPFEAVTNMYSVPSSKNVDPTPIFAFWYFMFYGMMFSDAAYGLIMTVICGIVLKKFRLEGMTQKMIKMFFFCGISTVFWGVIFGGYFGDLIPVIAKTFFGAGPEFTIPCVFVPLDDPIGLLAFCLVLGVIHLFIGMGANAYMCFRDGHPLDAVFDIFSWYMLILGLPLWFIGGSISPIVTKVGMVLTIVGALVILFTAGRNNKGIGKITGGLGALYGSTGYLSDILSYSRLLALGLATGVIASVINTMGTLAGGGIKGAIILTIAVVIGHTFNFAINALGSFVHAARLQYVELFGKFFEGGGEAFDPLKKNTKYVDIVNEK